jgi:ligand-binding sensor domain-containing protein/two-component sensor histidine kinase
MLLLKHFLLINAFILNSFLLTAQGSINFSNQIVSFTSKDGYPAGITFSIFQDKRGYLWVSSSNGLCRYDGYKFERIKEKYNLEGTIFSEIKGFGDKVFISSKTALLQYDYTKDSIKSTLYPDSLMADMMTFFAEYQNKIYVFNLLTRKGGPGSGTRHLLYDPVKNSFELIKGIDHRSPLMNVSNLDQLWAIGFLGEVYEMKSPLLFTYKTRLAEAITCVTYTGMHTWVAIDINKRSLIRIVKKEENYTVEKICDWKENAFQSRNNNILLKDSSILFYSEGHSIYKLKNNRVEKLLAAPDIYFVVYEDTKGNCWIGGLKGLYLLPAVAFREVQLDVSGLKYFYPVSMDAYGDMYVPVHEKGILKFNQQSLFNQNSKNTQYRLVYKHESGFTPWNLNIADSLLLIGSDEGFLVVKKNGWKHYRMNYPVLFDAVETPDKSGLFLAANRGIEQWVWAKEDTVATAFPELKGVRVYRFYKDLHKNIWCITDKGTGILRDGKFIRDSLFSAFKVNDLVEDFKNVYWISTGKGLFQYKNGKLSRVFEDIIQTGPYDMMITRENILVMSKGTTLYAIDLNESNASGNYSIHIFNEKNGFLVDDMNRKCFTEDASGRLWIDAMNKILVCEPRKLVSNPLTVLPKIKILQSDSRRITFFPDNRDKARKMVLKPGDDRLSFEYAGVCLLNPGDLFFRYRLMGLSDIWSGVTKETSVNYLHLKPGIYSFEVMASVDGINWTKPARTPDIQIQPFWYQTLFFKILLLLIIAGIIYMIHRYRVNQLLKINKIRADISSDLHDEIGSTLSSVNIYAGLAKKDPSNQLYLDSIQQNVTDVINKLDDLVWSIKPTEDTLGKIAERLSAYAVSAAALKGISFQLNLPEGLHEKSLPTDVKHHLYMVLKELANNAIKHSGASRILVDIENIKGELVITVSDNGKGFNSETARTDRNGLKNIRERVKEMKAKMEMSSQPGNGTKVKISLPD